MNEDLLKYYVNHADERFDKIEKRFDRIEQKIDQLEEYKWKLTGGTMVLIFVLEFAIFIWRH